MICVMAAIYSTDCMTFCYGNFVTVGIIIRSFGISIVIPVDNHIVVSITVYRRFLCQCHGRGCGLGSA